MSKRNAMKVKRGEKDMQINLVKEWKKEKEVNGKERKKERKKTCTVGQIDQE